MHGSSISGKGCGHSGNPDGCEVLIYFIDFISVTQYNKKSWRRIEAVITGRTRNALALRGTRVRIPPSPLRDCRRQIFANVTIPLIFKAVLSFHNLLFTP